MPKESHRDGRKDRAEPTPVLVRHIGTGQGHDVRPELVDCIVSNCMDCDCQWYSHKVSPVDARCPMPNAPGTPFVKSEPGGRAPVVEPSGRARWMKFTTGERLA